MNLRRPTRLGAALAPLAFWSACALAAPPLTHSGAVTSGALGAGCNGPINAVVEVADGSLYVGGDFSLCGEVSANNIARFNPSTQLWSALGNSQSNGVNGPVNTLAVHQGALFVGGAFTQVMPGSGAALSTSLARWDGSSWSRLAGDAEVSFEEVLSLHSSAAGLYVGGRLSVSSSEGDWFEGITLWTGERFAPIAPGAEANNIWVHSIALYNGEVHIAGILNALSIQDHRPGGARSLARWSNGSWRVVGSEGGGALEGNGVVRAQQLAVHEGSLYLGGEFSSVDAGATAPVSANNIARWNGSQWSALGTGVDDRVLTLLSTGEGILAGGRFATAGNRVIPKLARWTGVEWGTAASQPLGGSSSEVRALASSSQGPLVGGRFGWSHRGKAPKILNHVAQIISGEWSALGDASGAGANGPVYSLHEHLGALYAGGEFSTIGGVAANSIARHDGSGWHALGAPGHGVNGAVIALASLGDALVLGGTFTAIEQASQLFPAARLARWDGSTLSPLGPGVGLDDTVRALLPDGDGLIVGGSFGAASANGQTIQARSLARFEGNRWTVYGFDTSNGVQGYVSALAHFSGKLYVGGHFQFVPDPSGTSALEARGIAAWNGVAWERVGSGGGSGLSLMPNQPDFPAYVFAMQPSDQGLYIAGAFQEANAGGTTSVTVQNIALWTGTEWKPLGGSGQGVTGVVNALRMRGTQLLIGGSFSGIKSANGLETPSPFNAIHDRGRWIPSRTFAGADPASNVFALHPTSTGVIAAGWFGTVDDQPVSHLTELVIPRFLSNIDPYGPLQN